MNTARTPLNRPYELMLPQSQPAAGFTNKQPDPTPQQPVASSADLFSSPNHQGDVLRCLSPQQNLLGAQTMYMFNGRPYPEQIMLLRNAIRTIEIAIATKKANPTLDPMMKARALALLIGKKDVLVKLLNNLITRLSPSIPAYTHPQIRQAGPGLQQQNPRIAPASSATRIGAPLAGSLLWLLTFLKDQEPGFPFWPSVVSAGTISPIRQLLFSDDYVNVAMHLTDSSDVKNLLDFMLYLLHSGYISALGAGLEANRRARRFMFKVISKTPVIPKSMFITGVTVKVDVDCIGSGGFGLVFKGELQGKFVALKLLHKFSHRSIDFCREALTWRSLNHNFVLPLLGVYEHDSSSQLFLVSPYMENGTLAQWRKDANPSTTEIEDRILEVAQGIQYIHSEGIVHGDIRGDNILLDADFHVQIADFGLTRHLEATLTQSGARCQNFAAPELFGDWDSEDDTSDDGQSTARTQQSDIYAFGCLFYEIHYNTIPFSHVNEFRVMKSVTRGERAPRLKEPPLTDGAWKLIQDCWTQEKTIRPAIEEIVKRMIRQEDQTKLIGNNSTPVELASLNLRTEHVGKLLTPAMAIMLSHNSQSDVQHQMVSYQMPSGLVSAYAAAAKPGRIDSGVGLHMAPHSQSREKKHACHICHKRFDQSMALLQHSLVHTTRASSHNHHVRKCILKPIHTASISSNDSASESPSAHSVSPVPSNSSQMQGNSMNGHNNKRAWDVFCADQLTAPAQGGRPAPSDIKGAVFQKRRRRAPSPSQ